MSENGFEFSYLSKSEKRKILIAKVVLLAMILSSFGMMIYGEYRPMRAQYFHIAGILGAVCAYINVLQVKSEFSELFEPPYNYVAVEFAYLGLLAMAFGFYHYFTDF